MPVIKTV